MTIYEQFTKALFNADPELEEEIKALKFGCSVKIKLLRQTFKKDSRYSEYGNLFESKIISSLGEALHGQIGTEVIIKEIIGRDITLEDVLRALGKDFLIDGQGLLWKLNAGHPGSEARLKLGKPAHAQSEKTLLALIKLLQ